MVLFFKFKHSIKFWATWLRISGEMTMNFGQHDWFWVTWLRARWVSGDLTSYRFDCWEILPGQLGNKLLIQWCLAPVAGIWKERERGFGRERNAKIAQGRIRGRDFNIYLVDVYNAKTVVLWLLAGSSLPPSLVFLLHLKTPFPLKCLPRGLSDVSQSVYLFTLSLIYIRQFAYFGGLSWDMNCLIIECTFDIKGTKAEKMVTWKLRKYKKWNNGAVKPWD